MKKNRPNSPDLKYIFYQSPDFYYEFPVVGSQKYKKILNFFPISY
jgi:hypothetical protein